jgi:uncharacterized membrane protein
MIATAGVYLVWSPSDWSPERTIGSVFSLLACAPLLLSLSRSLTESPVPSVWELIWFAGCTGLSARVLLRTVNPSRLISEFHVPDRLPWMGLTCVSIVSCVWWFLQSRYYLLGFRLGFNDVGHFSQRVANTAEGRGFLLETPILPPFWDHFNPGLLLLVPLWKLWPSVELFLFLQATVLAAPALILASIAKTSGFSTLVSILWGVAWLLHPSIGQINLAYTYGWHPVTIAIPLILLGYRLALSRRNWLATLFVLMGCSFEEGVIVVVGCFAFAMILYTTYDKDPMAPWLPRWNRTTWLWIFVISCVAFTMIYSLSGLAPFQKGRFARLGNTPLEIIASPIIKPQEFFGLLFRERNFSFLALLTLPFVVCLQRRSLWVWIAVLFPLGVLLVWEHLPAQSIAFQYASCLLPIFFFGSISSVPQREWNNREQTGLNLACASIICSLILGLSIGQFPWSQASLLDVLGKTYELKNENQRIVGDPDQQWLLQQIASLRETRPTTLATGRIATHCVGFEDIETVGQFLQRRDSLAKLDPTLASPLLRFESLIIDLNEGFQQTPEETQQVRHEAKELGYRLIDAKYGLEIYRRRQD